MDVAARLRAFLVVRPTPLLFVLLALGLAPAVIGGGLAAATTPIAWLSALDERAVAPAPRAERPAGPPLASWLPTSSLVARSGHSATLLTDGRVLVAGGIASGTPLTSSQLLPAYGRGWSTADSLNTGRYYHTATLLQNGRVMVVGGLSPSALASTEQYNPTLDSWLTTGATLTTARAQHTATLLKDGRLLVVGGDRDSTPLASAERYDPAAGAFTAAGTLAASRREHTAVLLGDGRVLVAGGFGRDAGLGIDFTLNSVEIYNPTTNSWSGGGTLTTRRRGHTATLLADGKVLIAGGVNQGGVYETSAELFNPTTGTSTPAGTFTTGRSNHTATQLPSGQVLVAGGWAGGTTYLDSTALYDPGTNTWLPGGTMYAIHAYHTATLLPGGQVLIAGSVFGGTTTAEIYDPTAGALANVGAWSGANALTTARSGHSATLLPNGKVLVAAGFGASDFLASAQLFDPFTLQWTAAGNLATARAFHTTTLLPNGQVLVTGGSGPGGTLTGAELYNPATNSWSGAGTLAYSRMLHTATLLPDGRVLVVGGEGPGAIARGEVERYDPATNTWSVVASLSVARSSHSATLLRSGQVVVIGGEGGASAPSTAERYDPVANSWTSAGTLTIPRLAHTATLLAGGEVLIVGGIDMGTFDPTAGVEQYNPATNTIAPTGSLLTTPRTRHRALLLPNGEVLVAGGQTTGFTAIDGAERYDPAISNWSDAGTMSTSRHSHSLTLLPTGAALVVGGRAGATPTAAAETYTTPPGVWPAWRPRIDTYESPVVVGARLNMGGQNFAGIGEASGGGTATSATNYPLIHLRSIESGDVRLPPNSIFDWSANGATASVPTTFPPGYAILTIIANGIPSASRIIPVRGNGAPTSVSAGGPYAVGEGGTVSLTATASDPDGDPLLYAWDLDNNGTFETVDLDSDGESPSIIFSAVGRQGPTSQMVRVRVCDRFNGCTVSAPVTITITDSGATVWYFAEGYTAPSFDEYLTIQNPNPRAAEVRLTYYLSVGGPVVKTITVAASSRYTVAVHGASEGVGRGQAVSAKVESTNGVGIVVERPMYFTYASGGLSGITGGHNVMGVQAPRQSWLFAEGYTGDGFDQYLTLLNPHAQDAPVTITYYLGGGQPPVTKQFTVRHDSRYTVVVHETAQGVGRGQAVSARVETSLPGGIVAERPMYFRYGGSLGGVTGGHNVMGAASARLTWYFPDGVTETGFDQYLTLMNTTSTAASARLTYYVLGQPTPLTKDISVPANSRYTVAVHDAAEGVGRGKRHGTLVESTNDVPLVVERPLYFRYSATVNGGHNVMGAAALAATWLFAEGYTGPGFDEELVLLNPSATAATVTITYQRGGGQPPVTKTVSVPARGRYRVLVHGTTEGVGRNEAVSAKVETTHPGGIAVERPMYFVYGAGIDGGHTVMGYAP